MYPADTLANRRSVGRIMLIFISTYMVDICIDFFWGLFVISLLRKKNYYDNMRSLLRDFLVMQAELWLYA
ncbi:hypothetical protein NO1_0515 [Candidatus Termititenax aidoneus]|uniref:Uncharacterized protein n=1 Tax=Termititenax aidoneus TaxID=2218524 RepID=A0A388TBH0_TERA1|nr:hypothetical protein NO1_0515 [Candidatus Termititenax aidoneus]